MMNTILLSFAIVITLVNLALALSSFGYIVEMNKHMDEWLKMFKTLTEACSGLCEENSQVITSLMKHIEYTEKGFATKERDIKELNDRYDKLYEEFRKLGDRISGHVQLLYEYYTSNYDGTKDELEDAEEEPNEEENDDGLSSFWHEEEDKEDYDNRLEKQNEMPQKYVGRGDYRVYLSPREQREELDNINKRLVENNSESLIVKLTGISKLVPGESKSKVMEGYKFEIVGGQNGNSNNT